MSRGLHQICERVYRVRDRSWGCLRGDQTLLSVYMYIEITLGIVMLSYPALFAELIYPQLTPHGVILAVKLLGAWRLGRGGALALAPRYRRRSVAPWLAISSAPLHALALWGFGGGWLSLGGATSATWHGAHLMLSLLIIWAGRAHSDHPHSTAKLSLSSPDNQGGHKGPSAHR